MAKYFWFVGSVSGICSAGYIFGDKYSIIAFSISMLVGAICASIEKLEKD